MSIGIRGRAALLVMGIVGVMGCRTDQRQMPGEMEARAAEARAAEMRVAEQRAAVAVPPVAKKVPKEIVQHGEKRVDNYFWLREKENPETIKYLEAENAYTDSVMGPAKPLEEKLYKEILGRIKEDDSEVPYRKGDWLYYSRTETGKQYPFFCRKKYRFPGEAAPVPEEIVTLDVNKLAEGKEFYAIGDQEASDDGNMLAYTEDVTGFRQYTLRVKNLKTGKTLMDKIEKVDGVEWARDGKTLFYVIEDEAKRPYRMMRHVVGTPVENDRLVYEETDRLYDLGMGRTRKGDYIVATSSSKTTTECRIISTAQPDQPPTLIATRKEGHEYSLNQQGDQFYIRTNDKGPNFRLVKVSTNDPRQQKWEEVLPHREDVVLEGVDCFATGIAVYERANALPRMRLLDLKGLAASGEGAKAQAVEVKFPEAVCAIGSGTNEEYSATSVRVGYTSMLTPGTVYDVDLKTGALTLLKRKEVLGGYDPSKYVTERIYATAPDGAKVPISLVQRKDFAGKPCPMFLEGYGAYGFPQEVYFSSSNLTLLDRGVTVAIAHPRGGGDFGRRWYDAGRMMNKPNTFTDFIACADELVKKGYTTHEQLAITGGSAGGLLIGAVLNMRPDVAGVAILEVPFVDVLNTMSDDTLPLTTQEWIEWGNPNIKAEYESIKKYCPYTNIKDQKYPKMLVRTSLNDSQVMYHEPAKYVAKMRATRTDKNLLLLKVNMGAGHGGASGRYDALHETAFGFTFLLREVGVEK